VWVGVVGVWVLGVYEKFGCSSEAGLLEQLRPTVARM
jgi:hypothetical protein